jgi:hypothetical protein
MEIVLDFKGPFLLKDLERENNTTKHGIYIRGFKYPDKNKFIPSG